MITAFWYDLADEIKRYLRLTFTTELVTVEPDLINESDVRPVILIEWAGSTGSDIADDEKRSDRDKIVTLNFFIESYNSKTNLNSGKNRKLQYEKHSKLLQGLQAWNDLCGDVDYPLSDIVNWGDIVNEFPATKDNNEITRKGIAITVNFHHKGAY